MKCWHHSLFFACFLGVVGARPIDAGSRPNVLLICVDDLRPELHCYGVDYIHSPHIDARLKRAALSIPLRRHQPAELRATHC